jgi:hypothetical protein
LDISILSSLDARLIIVPGSASHNTKPDAHLLSDPLQEHIRPFEKFRKKGIKISMSMKFFTLILNIGQYYHLPLNCATDNVQMAAQILEIRDSSSIVYKYYIILTKLNGKIAGNH